VRPQTTRSVKQFHRTHFEAKPDAPTS
jgi:hypothetical protein